MSTTSTLRVTALVALALLVAASPRAAATPPWKLLLYVAADVPDVMGRSAIKRSADACLERLRAVAGGPDGVPFTALVDRGAGQGALELRWSPGTSLTERPTPSLNLGDGALLTAFLERTRDLPGEKTCLVVGGHGAGAVPASGRELRRIFERQPIARAGVASDEGDGGDCLTLAELAQALDRTGGVDLLVFDACHMHALEAGFALHRVVRRMVATPNVAPGGGVPLDWWAAASTGGDADELARAVAARANEACREAGLPPGFRVSCPAAAADVASALDRAIAAGTERLRRLPPFDPRRHRPEGAEASVTLEPLARALFAAPTGELSLLGLPPDDGLRAALARYEPGTSDATVTLWSPPPQDPLRLRALIDWYGQQDFGAGSSWDELLRLALLDTASL